MAEYTISKIVTPTGDICNIKDTTYDTATTSVNGLMSANDKNKLDNLAQINAFITTITTSQWSGSEGDYYITVNASAITENSILIPSFDHTSEGYILGPVWCVPTTGSFTIHTTEIPLDTITILVQILGVIGDIHYQTLPDILGLYIDNNGYICQHITGD